MYIPYFTIHLLQSVYLGFFYFLAMLNRVVMYDAKFLNISQRVKQLGNMTDIYCRHLKILHMDFLNGCTSLQPHGEWLRISLLQIIYYFFLLVFLILVILTRVKWYLKVVLISSPFIATDVENTLKCTLAIFFSSLENYLLTSIVIFKM